MSASPSSKQRSQRRVEADDENLISLIRELQHERSGRRDQALKGEPAAGCQILPLGEIVAYDPYLTLSRFLLS